jgi:hypothetical protein
VVANVAAVGVAKAAVVAAVAGNTGSLAQTCLQLPCRTSDLELASAID